MSRRKQTNPQHIETIKELTVILENGLASEAGNETIGRDEHVCGKCRAQFGELGDFITHKRSCTKKRPVLLLTEDLYDEAVFKKECPRSVSFPETVEDPDGGHNVIYEKPDSPYSEDMPSLVVKKPHPYDEDLAGDESANKKMSGKNILIHSLPHFPIGQISDTNVTIKALENTSVAVAQQGADSLQLGHIATLQSALCALQQQQLVQIQVIQQLQTQLIGTPNMPTTTTALTGSAALTPPQSGDSTITNSTVAPHSSTNTRATGNSNALVSTSSTASKPSDNLTDVGCTLALPPPSLPHEPNTLELLQRHTEQALQNTMSSGSFLLNGLSSLNNNNTDVLRLCKAKEGDSKSRDGGDEAFFRHRCKYCGKLFGSDSALQIHIRSHTGERPFKCNICGNRFSTKGNLKVHFQRHALKYPHIKMNPHPVPEHLDSLHPPIEPPEERCSKDSSPMSCENPNLSVIPTVSQIQDIDNGSPEDATSQEAGSPLQTRSLSPNEVSNMTDVSDASGDCFATEDNLEKDSEFLKGEDEDQRSFTSTPKASDEHKEDDVRSDDERKPLTGLDNNPDASPSLVPPFVVTTSTSFPSFFSPSFSPVCFPPGTTTSTVTTSASGNNSENINIHVDPAYYQNLLPKPGSNDNSWESLMEITKTSETSKLQQLVDNIEHKLSDPNQCVICHRVLSCKSALQMHYRTHTGERPFKCKICGRAFTTKGNLKTHMGVHRVKPPLRVLHQCPVCHKQFTNSLVLQQHIRTHTGEPTEMLPEHIMANEIKPHSMVHPSFIRPMSSPLPHNIPLSIASTMPIMSNMESSKEIESPEQESSPEPVNDGVIKPPSVSKDNKSEESESSNGATPPVTNTEDTPTTNAVMPTLTRSVSPDRVITSTSSYHTPYTASLVALENHVKAINSSISQPIPFSPFGLGLQMGGFLRYDDPNFVHRSLSKDGNREKSPPPTNNFSPSPSPSRAGSECSVDDRSSPGSQRKNDSPSPSVQPSSNQSENGALDLTPRTSILSKQISPTADIALFSPLGGMPFLPSGGRLNTTCKVCFKTFACHSALEIHYRSHTKERPYKCRVCVRGFSTKGNMKQHMLTHKIRDLPAQLFTSDESNPSLSAPNTPTPAANINSEQESNHHRDIAPTPPMNSVHQEPGNTTPSPKRTLSDGNTILPLPKRPPGMPKHMCHVCNKPFSSASALQIHMRTHTGDKPFKCNICSRAFTTKGNLKVHMGTHMWNNCTSRRGRRMSLELPGLPLPPGKPGDLPPPRPDLYFPYLPPAYVNGLTSTPKMNEISVIQTAGVTNGSVVTSSLNIMSPAVTTAADLPRPERDKNRKSPIVSSSEINSTVHRQGSPPASWSWKIACNICSKICSSSAELEMHIQCHYQPEGAKEDGNCASGERVSS